MGALVSIINVTSSTRAVQHGMSYVNDGRKLLDNISFEIPQGKCLGLFGEVNSGKMALTMGLIRIDEFDSGQFMIDGVDLRKMSLREFQGHRHRIQTVFPDRFGQLTKEFTVDRIFREILASRNKMKSGEIQSRIDEVMFQTGLAAATRRLKPAQLDAVERQLVALARALLQRPEFLILHNVTEGMDAIAQAELLNQIKTVTAENQLTSLYLADNPAVAYHMGDDLAILHKGRIVEQGEASQVINQPQHDYTKHLVSTLF